MISESLDFRSSGRSFWFISSCFHLLKSDVMYFGLLDGIKVYFRLWYCKGSFIFNARMVLEEL